MYWTSFPPPDLRGFVQDTLADPPEAVAFTSLGALHGSLVDRPRVHRVPFHNPFVF